MLVAWFSFEGRAFIYLHVSPCYRLVLFIYLLSCDVFIDDKIKIFIYFVFCVQLGILHFFFHL